MQYGLTIENQKLIIEKAKTKKNGCYTFRGVGYRVVDGHITHFATDNKILGVVCGFNVIVGNYNYYTSEGLKVLKSIKE